MYRESPRERLNAWLAKHVPEDAVRLRPPLEDPGTVPAPLRALYRVADGQTGKKGLFDQFRFMTASDAREEKVTMDQLARDESWDESWWSPRWHPFASDFAGQLLVVDESDGSVREFVHDDEGRPVLAPSAEAFLERFTESVEGGERVWDHTMGIVETAEVERSHVERAERAERDARDKKLARRVTAVWVAGSIVLVSAIILLDMCFRR